MFLEQRTSYLEWPLNHFAPFRKRHHIMPGRELWPKNVSGVPSAPVPGYVPLLVSSYLPRFIHPDVGLQLAVLRKSQPAIDIQPQR